MTRFTFRRHDPSEFDKIVSSRLRVLLRLCVLLALSILILVVESLLGIVSNSMVQSWSSRLMGLL